MSKYFCVAGGNMYIYTTGGEFILDLGVFPEELNLFEAEVAWRISSWLAVAEDVLQRTVDRASIILQLNEYSCHTMCWRTISGTARRLRCSRLWLLRLLWL